MHFVPAHNQSDEATFDLQPTKMPVEFVLIANEKGREAFLIHEQIHTILAPAIQATCRLKPAQPNVTSTQPTTTWIGTKYWTATHPIRTVPIRPATLAQTTMMGTVTPPRRRFAEATSKEPPSL